MAIKVDPFTFFKPQIDGSTGPYNSSTAEGWGANAGYNAGECAKLAAALDRDIVSIQNKNIQYTIQDKNTGKFSINGLLAYAIQSMAPFLNQNQPLNGKVEVPIIDQDDKAVQIAASLDNDPTKLSAAENATLTLYEDCLGKIDGIVTPEDQRLSTLMAENYPERTKEHMASLYDGHNMEKRAEEFVMPQMEAEAG